MWCYKWVNLLLRRNTTYFTKALQTIKETYDWIGLMRLKSSYEKKRKEYAKVIVD